MLDIGTIQPRVMLRPQRFVLVAERIKQTLVGPLWRLLELTLVALGLMKPLIWGEMLGS